jgi:hypothetical protein
VSCHDNAAAETCVVRIELRQSTAFVRRQKVFKNRRSVTIEVARESIPIERLDMRGYAWSPTFTFRRQHRFPGALSFRRFLKLPNGAGSRHSNSCDQTAMESSRVRQAKGEKKGGAIRPGLVHTLLTGNP